MRMKCVALTFLLVFAALPEILAQKGDSGAQNITSTVNTARYILFGGTYAVNGEKNGDNREPGVFKLDTYTGKVWMLKVEKTGTSRSLQWVPVEDPESISADGETPKADAGQKTGMKSLRTLDE